ncbi:unnamed protein product [Sphacelaria rigidula]
MIIPLSPMKCQTTHNVYSHVKICRGSNAINILHRRRKKKKRRRIGSFSALKNRYIQVCSPASNFHTFDVFILHHAVEEIYTQANFPQVYPLPGEPCLKVGRQMTGTIMGDSISSHPSIGRIFFSSFIFFL